MFKNQQDLVSVVITTKNEEKNIAKILKSIGKQIYKNVEIIVVDNNSTDNTKNKAQKFTKHIYNFGPERSAQRNFAVRKSHGKFVLILDADMILGKEVIDECVKMMNRHKEYKALVIPEKSFGEG